MRSVTRHCSLTSVAASVAHVCGDEAPPVSGRVVELHRGEVTRAVVPSDHIQQPVNGTDAWTEELGVMAREGKKMLHFMKHPAVFKEKQEKAPAGGCDYLTCVSPAHVHVTHQPPGVGLGVVHLHTLPHQRSVMSSCCVQLTAQHTNPCTGSESQVLLSTFILKHDRVHVQYVSYRWRKGEQNYLLAAVLNSNLLF